MKSTTGTASGAADGRQAPTPSASSRTRTACAALAFASVALFIVWVLRFYHPGTGFTALIGFPAGQEFKAPQLRDVRYYEYTGIGVYDGQFYAQRALDPLVRDPQVDRAMDLAPFRARRILFSWTAYIGGLGRPAWILEVYALQNVAAWLLLAVVLMRWLPPTTPAGLAAWAACLFSHGLLWSVRFALLDGPSLLLTALAIRLAENGRPFASAALIGVNGLGRETNLLGAFALPIPVRPRDWARLAGMALLVILPLLLWEDYLRSIYRSTIGAGADVQLTRPGVELVKMLRAILRSVRETGLFSPAGLELCILLPLVAQAVFLALRPRLKTEWWRVGIGYVLLLLVLDRVLLTPSTGAITRVMLPMTVAFNVLLARETRPSRFWGWFFAGNLHVIPGFWVL